MSKVIDAMAEGLRIRDNSGEVSKIKSVSEEVKQAFKDAMEKSLHKRSEHFNVGDIIQYDYCIGKVIGSKHELDMPIACPNRNLSDVFNELPELPEDLHYAFPQKTSAAFVITKKTSKEIQVEPIAVSPWIKETIGQ